MFMVIFLYHMDLWLVTIITMFLIIRTFLFISLPRNGRSNSMIAFEMKLIFITWIASTFPGKAVCNKHGSQYSI